MITGKQVKLRPVERSDLPLLEAGTNDVQIHGEYNIFGLRRTGGYERGFNENGFLSDQHGMLMIIVDNTVIGTVTYHQAVYGPNLASRVYSMGISIHTDYRGRGHGTEAQGLFAEYLFATYPIVRVEASTDITNLPEQRSLEKAGFTREGVLRKVQWRAGEWHDLVLYSKLRGE
jgi:aminoglycoside 6'-N-acetyltransferase